jgi:hypothetical protein
MTNIRFVSTLLAGIALASELGFAAAPQDEKPDLSRKAIVARAQVWQPTNVASRNLLSGPTGAESFAPGATVTCDYRDKKLDGASPKFVCELPNGDELKIKYGGTNGEVYGEVAASRLLWALGFGADRMYSVRVVCRGCPDHVGEIRRDNGDRIVDPAVVERRMPGEEVLDKWNWDELDIIDESAGGATRAQRDAFKLLAVLLQHSDNKPDQQRVVCTDRSSGNQKAPCKRPLVIIADLGITFGRSSALNSQPRASVNLAEWAKVPVWKDDESCVGNLSGSLTGTLKDPEISEEGRAFLARLLAQLTDRQIHDMFEAARVSLRLRRPGEGASGFATVDDWVRAFKDKRAEIVERRCRA